MSRTVRVATPQDMDRLRALHAAQNERDGTDYPMPHVADGSVLLALVTEDDNGQVRGSAFFELVGEMCFYGGDAEDTAELRSHIDAAAYILRGRGVTALHCFVPKPALPEGRKKGPVARALEWAGFTRDDHRFGHYFKDLRR